jgi:hypothetical protein
MEMIDLIQIWKPYFEEYTKYKDLHNEKMGYNVFTAISKKYRHENFHSQIIRSLLKADPKVTLRVFIEMLNKAAEVPDKSGRLVIDVNKFNNPKVEVEAKVKVGGKNRRIDIFITDTITNSAIIVESKIHGAQEQKDQIHDYFNYVKKRYKIEAIVNLSLFGLSEPSKYSLGNDEQIRDEIKRKLILLQAVHWNQTNLCQNWIDPCVLQTSNINLLAILKQYRELLMDISKEHIKMGQAKELYDLITNKSITETQKSDKLTSKDIFEIAGNLKKAYDSLQEYRAALIKNYYQSNNSEESFYEKLDGPWQPKKSNFWLAKFHNIKKTNINFRIECHPDTYRITLNNPTDKNRNDGFNKELKTIITKLEGFTADNRPEQMEYFKVCEFPEAGDILLILNDILKKGFGVKKNEDIQDSGK